MPLSDFSVSVEDIYARPIGYESDKYMKVTRGCPCDACTYRATCVDECRTFRQYTVYGARARLIEPAASRRQRTGVTHD